MTHCTYCGVPFRGGATQHRPGCVVLRIIHASAARPAAPKP